MEDRDRERLGRRCGGHRRRDLQGDNVAGVHGVACPDYLLVQADVSVSDQALDPRAGAFRQYRGDAMVQPRAVVLVGHVETQRFGDDVASRQPVVVAHVVL